MQLSNYYNNYNATLFCVFYVNMFTLIWRSVKNAYFYHNYRLFKYYFF